MSYPDLSFHLRSLSRLIYFVTDEEDRFINKLREILKKHVDRTQVFNAAFGMQPIEGLVRDWTSRAHAVNTDTVSIHDALIRIYKDDPKEEQNFYVITDPERWLADAHVVRRILNIVHQQRQDIRSVKIIIFVGSRRFVPEKLQRYMEVINDQGLTSEETLAIVEKACTSLKAEVPRDTEQLFRGLTAYETESVVGQSIVRTRRDSVGRRVDPQYIADFRRRQLMKTDLVQHVDTAAFSFDIVGGQGRFKDWAYKTRYAWTQKGQKFGLKPPKGVLALGVWGCGKSLSVKAMGHAWGLPVIQLEMGRLRSSGVGESEANVYKAIRIIENSAPALVWIDEAEKSLSGGASSAQSDAGTTSRTIGILSTWIQETPAAVCLAMTANSLKNLPVEFVNRMDERFFFDMPSEEDRIDILKIHLKKAGQDPSGYNLAMLAERAGNMVGREIEQAIGAAMIESFAQEKIRLDEDILADELLKKPRIIKTMADEVKEITDWVGYDNSVGDGIRARYASKPNTSGGALQLVREGDTP